MFNDRGLSKMPIYLKEHDLLAVPHDNGTGFGKMRKSTYQTKLDQVLDCPQFSRIDASDDIITNIEKVINSTLLEKKKTGINNREK